MIPSRWSIAFLCAVSVVGCHSAADTTVPPGDFDPVLNLVPLTGTYYILQFEHGQKFDAGVALVRTQLPDGSQSMNNLPLARMAFASNGYPVQVNTAVVNGVNLTWLPDAAIMPSSIYSTNDSNAYGAPDSLTFTYRDFDGETFTATVGTAPSFGKISCPDTVSAAAGCRLTYEHAVPGDSIMVTIQGSDPSGTVHPFGWMIPDTGGFVIQPNELTYLPNGLSNEYSVDIFRVHWDAITSPSGKHIGIFSWQDVTAFGFYVKP